MADNSDILSLYRNKCVICRHPTNSVHEIIPKSRKVDWMCWTNRIALCGVCHDKVHNLGTKPQEDFLILQRDRRLFEYYGKKAST